MNLGWDTIQPPKQVGSVRHLQVWLWGPWYISTQDSFASQPALINDALAPLLCLLTWLPAPLPQPRPLLVSSWSVEAWH